MSVLTTWQLASPTATCPRDQGGSCSASMTELWKSHVVISTVFYCSYWSALIQCGRDCKRVRISGRKDRWGPSRRLGRVSEVNATLGVVTTKAHPGKFGCCVSGGQIEGTRSPVQICISDLYFSCLEAPRPRYQWLWVLATLDHTFSLGSRYHILDALPFLGVCSKCLSFCFGFPASRYFRRGMSHVEVFVGAGSYLVLRPFCQCLIYPVTLQ